MKIFIATDYRLLKNDNHLYANSKFYSILKRYYDYFGEIVLCTRLAEIDKVSDKEIDITDLLISHVKINSAERSMIHLEDKKMRMEIRNCDLVICRCPAIMAYRAADIAKKEGKPYFTESVSCAWDDYWNHGIYGKIVAPYMFYKMKSVVKNADYALYVTDEFLQHRYPSNKKSVGVSNVNIRIPDVSILENRLRKIKNMNKRNIRIMTAAAVNVKAKGQSYMIKAIPILKRAGINVTYVIAGEGDNSYLSRVSKVNHVEKNIIFTGNLTSEEVLEQLDLCDIYIQPSLQEGLPRSVIEAMSRGCICLGARTAGIPELIPKDCVFKRKSYKAISNAIIKLLEKDLSRYAKLNYEYSKKYDVINLKEKRNNYYDYVKDNVENI